MTEKCAIDPGRECLGLAESALLRKRIEDLEQWQKDSKKFHNDFYDWQQEQIANIDMATAYTMRAVIEDSVTALDDETAATVPSLFTPWAVGEAVEVGDRRYYAPRLYKVVQAHTTQADWTPDKTPAMWAVVDVDHAGTLDDPIPAARGMDYIYGKYYSDPEDGRIYLCKRTGEEPGGTINLQYLPHELIGQYFEAVV